MTFNNPAGLWTLLGIPLVLLIHFLQRKAKSLPVSTLFLLERTQRESRGGRRFDRLTPSIPLWMQILFVLLLAWLLAEPRYPRSDSVQRVAIVLDSSASMQAFRNPLIDSLRQRLPTLAGAATSAEYLILESHPDRPPIYSGTSHDECLAALSEWKPTAGTLDPTAALRIARSLVGRDGLLIYATDTARESLPFDAQLLSVGEPLENLGFTGVSFSEAEGALVWEAMIRNHGTTPQQRTWHVEMADGSSTRPQPVALDPGQIVRLQAAFPAGDRCRIVLSGDGFAADDVLPLVRPMPKPLRMHAGAGPAQPIFNRLIESIEGAVAVEDPSTADVLLGAFDPLVPVFPSGNAVLSVNAAPHRSPYLSGEIVAERHPLIDDLNWQALLVRESPRLAPEPSDETLLWQGDAPLILLRSYGHASQQLIFNFDLTRSNADRLPAFVLTVHRFAERIRQQKVAPSAGVFETGQLIELAYATGPDAAPLEMTVEYADGTREHWASRPGQPLPRLAAPRDPGFFRVAQGEVELLRGSAYFADAREADFTAAASRDEVDPAPAAVIERQTREDHLWRLWVLAALGCLMIAWHFTKTPTRAPASA